MSISFYIHKKDLYEGIRLSRRSINKMCIDTNYNICILSLGLLYFLHRQLTENLCYIAILELKGEIQTMVM